MNGLYTETCIKRKTTMGTTVLKVLYIFAAVVFMGMGVLLLGTGLLGYIISFIGLALVFSMFIMLPRFNAEFEYIFCDGQIDFDRINGGEKRKNVLKIDMDNIEILAPETSHQLDSYRNVQGLKIKDFSSKDPEARKYCIFMAQGTEKTMIIFEPSEKMVDFAKQKAPRKVFKD